MVHYHNQVELFKVVKGEFFCAMLENQPIFPSVLQGAAVGIFTYMVATGARAVSVNKVIKQVVFYMLFKQGLCQRGAANIAKANKHYLVFRLCHHAKLHPAHLCAGFIFGVAFAAAGPAGSQGNQDQNPSGDPCECVFAHTFYNAKAGIKLCI